MLKLEKPSLILAIRDAFLSLTHPTIVLHMLWPIILGFILWIFLYIGLWFIVEPIILPFTESLQQDLPQWLIRIGIAGVFMFTIQALLAIILMPIIYLTFVIIISLFSIPLCLPIIINKNYPQLQSRYQSSFFASIKITTIASTIFLFFYLASFSLWILFAPAIFVAHIICTAFLNKSTFLFDALANHATTAEYEKIKSDYAKPLFLLGLLCAMLTYIPFLNLLAPAIAALCFINYSLSALEFIRENENSISNELKINGGEILIAREEN